MDAAGPPGTVIEVWADVCCPFTHVGLRRFVEHRDRLQRADVRLRVRAWPLELVNGQPLDGDMIDEEVAELRSTVASELFARFDVAAFPASSLPALAVAAAAYRRDIATGEQVSLALRTLLFEEGQDIADPEVLVPVEQRFQVEVDDDLDAVHADWDEGRRRGVVGSPHFFTPDGAFFCPALDVSRDDAGHLRVFADPEGFERFLEACFA